MSTHSSILAGRTPWTEKPGGLQSMGLQESDMTQRLNHQTTTYEGIKELTSNQIESNDFHICQASESADSFELTEKVCQNGKSDLI